jgi:hypothetical protein
MTRASVIIIIVPLLVSLGCSKHPQPIADKEALIVAHRDLVSRGYDPSQMRVWIHRPLMTTDSLWSYPPFRPYTDRDHQQLKAILRDRQFWMVSCKIKEAMGGVCFLFIDRATGDVLHFLNIDA